MPHKITYYAIIDGDTTAIDPYGLVRRLDHDDGLEDEDLRRDFSWSSPRRSSSGNTVSSMTS